MKTLKKSFVALFLICALLASAVVVSAVSVSAESSPQLNLVRGDNCFNVVWNKVSGAVKYRLYFGTKSSTGNGWRRYTDLKSGEYSEHPKYTGSWQFLIDSNSLRGRKWYKYGDDKDISTPSLITKTVYKCMVEAFNAGDRCIASTNIDFVCFGSTLVNRLNGDVNNDGRVAVKDVTEIQRYLINLTTLDDESKIAADVNFDGTVNIADATDIQRYLSEFITGFNALKDTNWTSLEMASEKIIRFQNSASQVNVKIMVPEAAKSWLTAEPNVSNGAVKEIKLTTKDYTQKGIVRSATVTIDLEGKEHKAFVKQIPKGENNYSYTAYDSDFKTVAWNVPSKDRASVLQGMAVSSQYIYTAKIKSNNEAAIIYKTDTKANKKTAVPLVYNGDTLVYSCLGHANDMEVTSYKDNNGYETLLVATAGENGIALVDVDNRDAVNEIKNIRNIYPYYVDKDGKSLNIKPTAIAIETSTDSDTDLFIKEGKQIYKGHIDSNIADGTNVRFIQVFQIDRATGDIVKEYDSKSGKYVTRRFTAQGISYRNGSLYAVFSCCDERDNSYYNLSEVLRYDSVDGVTNNNEVTYSECYRIQSDTFEFFEMEACGFLGGRLYFNANRERNVKNFTDQEDGILYFNNLDFNSK